MSSTSGSRRAAALLAATAALLLSAALTGSALAGPAPDRPGAPAAAARAARTSPSAILGSALVRGATLGPGDALQSPSQRYSLVMGGDGILRYQDAPNRLNSAPAARQLAKGPAGSFLILQTDGNLVVYSPTFAVVADFGTAGSTAEQLVLQDDSNLVLYGAGGAVVINFGFPVDSFLLPGEVLLPGDRLQSTTGETVMVMQDDGNLVIYNSGAPAFATNTFGAGIAAILQEDGNFVLYTDTTPKAALFNTGTFGSSPDGGLVLGVGSFRIYVDGDDMPEYGSAWSSATVTPGQALNRGERRTSPSGNCVLLLQDDGNLVDYCSGQVAFNAATSGDFASMDRSGEFVVIEVDLDIVQFSTGTRVPGSRLVVQDDGNVVVYTPNNQPVFSLLR